MLGRGGEAWDEQMSYGMQSSNTEEVRHGGAVHQRYGRRL
jgi:hypothetical protein